MTNESANVIQPADADDQREFWKRLADMRVMMLTTHDAHDDAGTLTARPVAPLKVDPDGQLWFFTAMDGGIANDIRRDPEVHLSFRPTIGQSYAVEVRAALSPGDWQTLTNLGLASDVAPVTVTDTLLPTNRFYRVITQ